MPEVGPFYFEKVNTQRKDTRRKDQRRNTSNWHHILELHIGQALHFYGFIERLLSMRFEFSFLFSPCKIKINLIIKYGKLQLTKHFILQK